MAGHDEGMTWAEHVLEELYSSLEPILGRGCDEALASENKDFFSEKGGGIQWMRALVSMSTVKAIQWRGPGYSVNRWTLKIWRKVAALIAFPTHNQLLSSVAAAPIVKIQRQERQCFCRVAVALQQTDGQREKAKGFLPKASQRSQDAINRMIAMFTEVLALPRVPILVVKENPEGQRHTNNNKLSVTLLRTVSEYCSACVSRVGLSNSTK